MTKSAHLQPHFQGAKGESRFSEMCSDAELICNKSTQDLGGWDFIVEFGLENTARPYDERKEASSCRIQVKTLQQGRKAFAMRLSCAERLTKDPSPAFVCVFIVNENREFTGAYLIHFNDERMSAVLKRLRTEHAKDTPANQINRKTISFTAKDSELIECSGISLKKALLAYIGNDLYVYAERKRRQLERLGYEAAPFTGRMKIHAESHEELVDIFLGLRKAEVSGFQVAKRRFGISIPEITEATGVIHIEPNKADTCKVLYVNDNLDRPAAFSAEVFMPAIPDLPAESFKIHIKNQHFSIILGRGHYTINFGTQPELATLEEWSAYCLFRSYVASGEGEVHIRSGTSLKDIKLPTALRPDMDSSFHKKMYELCSNLGILFTKAGIPHTTLLSIEDIHRNENSINLMVGSINGDHPSVYLETKQLSSIQEKVEAVFPIFIRFEHLTLASYGVMECSVTTKGASLVWESVHYRSRIVSEIPKGTEDDFIQEAQTRENLLNLIQYEAILDDENQETITQ